MVALRRFRALLGHEKGGCWLQVAGGCSLQVQINVKCHSGFQGWLLFTGGCSLEVVVYAGLAVLQMLFIIIVMLTLMALKGFLQFLGPVTYIIIVKYEYI